MVQLLCSSISIVFQRILVSVRFNDIGPSSGVSWLKKIAAFRVDSVFWSGLDTFKLRHLSGYSGQMDQINNFFDKKLMSESFKVSLSTQISCVEAFLHDQEKRPWAYVDTMNSYSNFGTQCRVYRRKLLNKQFLVTLLIQITITIQKWDEHIFTFSISVVLVHFAFDKTFSYSNFEVFLPPFSQS